MARNPYDAHLCAQDPDGFARGFERATGWIRTAHPSRALLVYAAVAASTDRSWPDTADLIGFRHTAYGEGLALGIYGLKALEVLDG